MEYTKTEVRWFFGFFIVFCLTFAIVIASKNFANPTITFNSDSNTYNITKLAAETIQALNDKQDYYYKQYVRCEAILQVNNLSMGGWQ